MTQVSNQPKSKKTFVVRKTSAVGKSEALYQELARNYGTKFLFDIFPDYWKETWGEVPRLGTVRADSEFYAVRAAYDKGLLIQNATFGPKAVKRMKK